MAPPTGDDIPAGSGDGSDDAAAERPALDGIGEPVDAGVGLRMRSGLRWSLFSTVLNRLLNPLTGIILARLLSPKDFGIFAVALIALNGLTSINELGVTYAVVRWPGDLDKAARTATSIAVGMSVAVFGACFVIAPYFAEALKTPSATGVLRLIAVGVIIDGIGSVPIGLLTRGFRQDRRAAAEWAGFVVSTSLTIGLAIAGFGAWSLAWGRLAGNATSVTMLFLLAPKRYRPGWNTSIARELLRFGIPLTASSFLVFAMLNVDYVVVGHELGTVALGFYTLAFNLSSFPWNMLSTAVRPVAVPAFARYQNDRPSLRAVFLRWLHLLITATVPLCALLGVLALPLVTVVYGEQWEPAASALVFLAALGGIRVALDYCYDLFVAVGETPVLVRIQALWLIALIPVLTVGARLDGIRGVAIGHVIVASLIITPTYLFALAHRHGIRPLSVLGRLWRPLLGGAAAVALAVALMTIPHTSVGELLIGAAGVIVAYGVVGVSKRELRELPRMFSRRRDEAGANFAS